jgi:type I restriction enzyme S subunit
MLEAVDSFEMDVPVLPAGWAYARLGDLLEPDGLSYGVVQPGSVDSDGVPVLRVKNLRNGRILADDVARVSVEIEQKHRRTRLRGSEVLLSLVGSVGEVATVPSELAGWNVARAIGVLRPASGVSGEWIRLCLTTELAQHCMRSWQNETVQATLNLRDVRRLPIVMPPERTRHAITAVLGALDNKFAANDRVSSDCRTIGDLLVSSNSAAGAEAQTFADLQRRGLLAFGDGYRTKRGEHGRPGLPILRAADIGHGMLTASAQDYVSEQFRRAMGPKISRPGDVVLTTKGTVGRVAVVPEASPEFVYSPQLCYFRVAPGSRMSPSFLFYWFRGRQFWTQADSLKGKTDMADYINLADIGSLTINLPGGESLLAQLDALEMAAMQMQAENRTLAELRDALLPRLMSGEIRVRDAEKVMEEAL